jgi:sortase A
MLLKIGLALSTVAAVFAVATIALVATRDEPEKPVASSAETTAEKPLALQRSYREKPEPSAKRQTVTEKAPPVERQTPVEERGVSPQKTPISGEATPLPAGNPGWSVPEEDELARLEEPRRFAPDPDAGLTLTLPSLGVYGAPVYDSDSPAALDAGVGHVPETSMPWDESPHKNTYLAAHRLGYEGTGSRLLFYELDQLQRGDVVVLRGRGETYRYKVTEKMVVGPTDSAVMGRVVGRDMVSLQTCTPIPTFEKRLVVRADRI